MPERRQEKRPPFNEKGGRTVGGGAGDSRDGGGSTPPPNRPNAPKSLFDWGLSLKKSRKEGGRLKSEAHLGDLLARVRRPKQGDLSIKTLTLTLTFT